MGKTEDERDGFVAKLLATTRGARLWTKKRLKV
jgi:hypothetical protein